MKTKLFLAIVLPILLFSHSNNIDIRAQLTPSELKWLDKKEPLTYAYDPCWRPFEWQNELQEHDGIIADIMTIIKKKTGINFIAHNADTWKESVELVQNKKVNMFSAITQNEERKKYLKFTSNDIFSYPALFLTTFDDQKVYLNIEKDLKDKKVGIVEDSGLGKYIQNKYPSLNYVILPSTKRGFESLKNREIDIFTINAITAKYYIENKYSNEIKIAMKLDYIYRLKMAIHKSLPDEVISILDKALLAISKEDLNHIFHKGTNTKLDESFDWKVVIQVISLFIFLLFLYTMYNRLYNRKLRLMINHRTEKLNKLNKKFRELAETDILTGIPNRLHLKHDFEHLLKSVDSSDKKMALFFLDLNNFKEINDTYGHGVGDNLLQKIAKKISSTLNENEKVYRVGGDEFCILVKEFSNKEALEAVALRIIDTIADDNLSHGNTFNVGCSIGIALLPDDGGTLKDLMAKADSAMYTIKSSGKSHFKFAQ